MDNFKNSLLWYSIKKFLKSIPLILVVVLFCFLVIQLAPGDPISIYAGTDEITEETRAMLEREWGLDQPLINQCLTYLKNMLTFNLGHSYKMSRPVMDVILERLPATLLLMLPALAIASILGVAVGIYCSKHMHTLGDSIVSIVALAGYSVPLFWIGQMLLLIFAMKLKILPVSGMTDVRAEYTGIRLIWDVFKHLILPGSCLVFYYSAMILRVTRTKMAEVLQTDYIKTARAKGVPERKVLKKHALRNALAPVITVIGMEMGSMVMGATVVESLFGYPGTGKLIYDAVSNRDYPLIAGMFFFIGFSVIISNILVDILYAVVDPQVRYD